MYRAALVVFAALGGCVQKVDLPIACRPAPSPAGWVRCQNVDFDGDFPSIPTAQQFDAFGQRLVTWTSALESGASYSVSVLEGQSFGPTYDKAFKDALSIGHDVVAERHVDTQTGRALELDVKRGDKSRRMRIIDQPARKRRFMVDVSGIRSHGEAAAGFFDNFAPRP